VGQEWNFGAERLEKTGRQKRSAENKGRGAPYPMMALPGKMLEIFGKISTPEENEYWLHRTQIHVASNFQHLH